jgi:hypothetical protein
VLAKTINKIINVELNSQQQFGCPLDGGYFFFHFGPFVVFT